MYCDHRCTLVLPVHINFTKLQYLIYQGEDDQKLNLRNGQSAKLSILVQTPETQQLGEISASIVITSREVSKAMHSNHSYSAIRYFNEFDHSCGR